MAEIGPAHLRALIQDAHVGLLLGAGSPSAYFSLLGDIEIALTRVEEGGLSAEAGAVARASLEAHFFRGVVEPNIALLAREAAAQPVLQSYGRLGRSLNRLMLHRRSSLLPKKVTLFTTNVDLAVEVAFERLGLDLNDGFSGKIDPVLDLASLGTVHYRMAARYSRLAEIPTFDLYKLHGSVSWRLAESGPAPIAYDHRLQQVHTVSAALSESEGILDVGANDENEINIDDLLTRAAQVESVPPGVEAFTEAYRRLVVVNPEKTKFETTVFSETYYELLRRFANELERENALLLVHGFSFRDEHLRTLILRAASMNPTLQVVVFCYQQADRDGYEALMPASSVPNANVLYVVPSGEDSRIDIDALVDTYLDPLVGPDTGTDELAELLA